MSLQKKNSPLDRLFMVLVFLFLYAPIFLLIIFSFNAGNSSVVWKGFSLKWYGELFRDRLIMQSVYTTLLVSLLATIISTIAGTSVALGLGIEQVAGCLAGTGMPEWIGTVFGSSALVVATLMAIILNLILPQEKPTIRLSVEEEKAQDLGVQLEVAAGNEPIDAPKIPVDAHGTVIEPPTEPSGK